MGLGGVSSFSISLLLPVRPGQPWFTKLENGESLQRWSHSCWWRWSCSPILVSRGTATVKTKPHHHVDPCGGRAENLCCRLSYKNMERSVMSSLSGEPYSFSNISRSSSNTTFVKDKISTNTLVIHPLALIILCYS